MTAAADDGDSFYHLASVELVDQPCQGTACFAARQRVDRWSAVEASIPAVYCLGRCYAAPVTAANRVEPAVTVAAPASVVLERVVARVGPDLAAYAAHGGYEALEHVAARSPAAIVDELERSGLRGRGGAGFPTGRKWRAVLERPSAVKHVVCNADEGDPGAYIDRVILERDPHCVLEGMAIAARAVEATRGWVYVRKEYPAAAAAIRRAVDEARLAGILGTGAHGQPSFDVEVVDGRGSYVCGEETALLNALEGRRPEVRPRPPYPAEAGLWGAPTLVDNVETLANVAWIVRSGGDAYAALGRGTSRGTKVVSLNSLFRHPGLYEVEFGQPVRALVEDLGGGLAAGSLHGVLIGGPLAGILPPQLLDTAFGFDELQQVGAAVGHGGVVAFDESTPILELAHHVFRFGAAESCGKCTPCRGGAPWIEGVFAAALAGRPAGSESEAEWRGTVDALAATSLCGHGSGLADFARSVLAYYPNELDQCFG
jgi:NADH:ubiquinone oxidoreductase subunit F (NADH-binding)